MRCGACAWTNRAVRLGGSADRSASGPRPRPAGDRVHAHATEWRSGARCRPAPGRGIGTSRAFAAVPADERRRSSAEDPPRTAALDRAAAGQRTGRATRHATRCPGRSCLWKRGNSLPCRRLSARPPSARRAIIAVTADRPCRHALAQRANPAATSCNALMRRTSCSRGSPSRRGGEGVSEPGRSRLSTIPGEASAASWYHAALST
jgi:hypothetical protein